MLDKSGFIVGKKGVAIDRSAFLRRKIAPVEFMTVEELMQIPAGSIFFFDVECYINFFYVAFKCARTGKFFAFELSPDLQLNATLLSFMMWKHCIVGFNSTNYDVPMLSLAIAGASTEELKHASDYIIKSGPQYGTEKVTPYAFAKKYRLRIAKYNHIDLIAVAPLEGSLKLYAGRLHCPTMQDLPFPDTHVLTQEDASIIRPYCCNDLNNTELLYNELAPEIELRCEMTEKYGVDLRSKSDAQIAEAVINSELEKILGYYPQRPVVDRDLLLKYNVPDFVCFQTPELNKALEQIRNAEFQLDGGGSPIWPAGLGEIEKTKSGASWVLRVNIGKSTYKVGMGGLHSQEESAAHIAGPDEIIADNDVESFYPRTILNQRLFPPDLGEAFLVVYESIVNSRLDAKGKAKALKATDRIAAAGFKTVADTLKIVINGSFGKLGNKFSTLYAPQLMLQVTITGQLVLLMLIEALEGIGIEIVSGNTDGIIAKYHKSRHDEVRRMIAAWEAHTAYKTEETRYKAVFSRDVNNYVAVKEDGDSEARFLDEQLGLKTKGVFSERGSALNSILSKNPETLICTDAVLQMIANKTPIEKTIRECKDIRRFISIKNVKGGGAKNGEYLGKVVRWYYAENEASHIAYVGSGNKVSKTDGAKPLMELPREFPIDINYDWYIKTAVDMLFKLGYLSKPKTLSLF